MQRLYQFQAKQIEQYECHSCGEFFCPDSDNEIPINDQGERGCVLVCDKCLDRGWLQWGRP